MEGQQVSESVRRHGDVRRQGDRVVAAGGGFDALINRVSDSTRFCLWDKSSRRRRRAAASGSCGVMRAYLPRSVAHHCSPLTSPQTSHEMGCRFCIKMPVCVCVNVCVGVIHFYVQPQRHQCLRHAVGFVS